MKCHPERWIWGLIPIAMLSWIAVHVEADRMERDLEQRARNALAQAGYGWASIVFSGRDGLLVGTPRRPREQTEALALVRSLWGVRVVTGRRTPVAELAAAGFTPERQRGIAPDETLKSADIVVLPEMRPSSVAAAEPVALKALMTAPVRPSAQGDASDDRDDAQKTQNPSSTVSIATAALPRRFALPDAECSAAVQEMSSLEPIRFARGAVDLDGRSQAMLERLAAAAKICPSVKLQISGHADADGPASRNMSLSKRRARVVVSYLITKGIDAGRLKAVGYGETRPVAPNDTAQNRAKNRRIEVEVTGLGSLQAGPGAKAGQGAVDGLSDR